MTAKRKKRTPPKRPDDARLAEILSYADKTTPKAASAKFSVSERTIWRWRAAMAAGKLSGVSDLVSGLKAEALERCKDLLAEVYEAALIQLKAKLPSATYRETLDTATATGELKAFRDGMNDDERGSATGQGSDGQAGQGPNQSAASGAGAKTLRVVS